MIMMRGVCVSCVAGQSTITPLALLILGDAFEQMHAAELRPERGSNVDFGICELPHQEVDFAARTLLPVLFRKGIKRERRNADARGCFDRRPYGRYSGTVSGNPRQMAAARPPSVAVHDDGDVLWEPRWIEPMINFRL